MSAALHLMWAAWAVSFNTRWRFSRYKSGLWIALLQLAFGAGLLWRLSPAAGAGTPALAALTMLAQAGGWAFLITFLTERQTLYGSRQMPLVLLSPAPDLAPVLAAVGTGLPRRAWSTLLWGVALATILPPGGGRWLWLPLLWLLGIAAGALGQLGGLLTLIAWVRLAPRALHAIWAAVLVGQVVLVYYAIYLLATGLSLNRLEALAGALRGWVGTGLAALLAAPGLVMALGLVVAPERVGAVYREGWLALADLADAGARPRRSRWPALGVGGASGAVLAKEWLQMGRNPVTYFRLGILLVLLSLLVPARPYLAVLEGPGLALAVLGGGAGTVVFCLIELPAALFGNEGARLGLLAAAGTRPGSLLAGKLAAVAPMGLLAGAAGWAVSWAAGRPDLSLALLAGALGLGAAGVAVAGGAFDVAFAEATEEADGGPMAALLEQVPRGLGGNVGLMGAAGWTGAAIWAVWAGRPVWLIPLGLLVVMVVLAAWVRLWQVLDRGGARR
jgi:hypothetical protein